MSSVCSEGSGSVLFLRGSQADLHLCVRAAPAAIRVRSAASKAGIEKGGGSGGGPGHDDPEPCSVCAAPVRHPERLNRLLTGSVDRSGASCQKERRAGEGCLDPMGRWERGLPVPDSVDRLVLLHQPLSGPLFLQV